MRAAASLALTFGLLTPGPLAAAPLELSVHPIAAFAFGGADLPEGPVEFLGGLQLASDNDEFGGFSGIDIVDGGKTAFLVSDSGSFVRIGLQHEEGRLTGVADAAIDSLFPNGDVSKEHGDVEDVALDPADPSRGVVVRERQANAMLTFELTDGRPVDFQPMTVGVDDRLLRSNRGLESVAYAPRTSPLAGGIVAIAEGPPRGAANIPGWSAGKGSFDIVPHDDFDVSSARFLPNGDLILLERRFAPASGIALRIRRIAGETVRLGALVDGTYVLDAGMTSQIDNMEGLAVHADQAGRTILTLVSDDNFNALQRTLILQFALTKD
jgi:hypothetical protein